MAGLNKIVDEIGRQMSDPFKVKIFFFLLIKKNLKEQSLTTLNPSLHNSSEISTSTEGTTLAEIMAEILQVENNGTAVDGEVKGEIKERWNNNGNQMTAWLIF